MKPRHIIGFGNELHGDDGFGSAVCRHLAALPLPADVRVFEAGTRGLDALALLAGCREAILVDALSGGGRPGRLRLLSPEALAGVPETAAGHGQGVAYLLRALAALGEPLPALRILVAEGACLRPFAPGLSPAMARAARHAAALLRRSLTKVAE